MKSFGIKERIIDEYKKKSIIFHNKNTVSVGSTYVTCDGSKSKRHNNFPPEILNSELK